MPAYLYDSPRQPMSLPLRDSLCGPPSTCRASDAGARRGVLAHVRAANPVAADTRPRNVALLYIINT